MINLTHYLVLKLLFTAFYWLLHKKRELKNGMNMALRHILLHLIIIKTAWLKFKGKQNHWNENFLLKLATHGKNSKGTNWNSLSVCPPAWKPLIKKILKGVKRKIVGQKAATSNQMQPLLGYFYSWQGWLSKYNKHSGKFV